MNRLASCLVRWKTVTQLGVWLALLHSAQAATFPYPAVESDGLIDNNQGQPRYVKTKQEDTLIDIAMDNLLGQEEIVRANKGIDRWLPGAGKDVLIPSRYLLPAAPRQGIVINLPEYRLYYYPPAALNQPRQVISYSVGIGRVDWKTPLGVTSVVAKVKNPTWTPPASIKEEHRQNGDILPDVWPAGPDNPLGLFAFRLGIPGYLLHSTNKAQGVGMQVSHGCMRLYPKDIEKMFPLVNVGTPVTIVNQPIKVGWLNGDLYIESHPNLEGEEISAEQRLTLALDLVEKALAQHLTTLNGEALQAALVANNGLPTLISNKDVLPELLIPTTVEPPVPVAPAPVFETPPPVVPPVTPVIVPPVVKPPVFIPPTVVPPVSKPPVNKTPPRPVAPVPPPLPKKVIPKPLAPVPEWPQLQEERVFKTSPFPLK
jgi:L,D-transpeptidase ErfK/SrfK